MNRRQFFKRTSAFIAGILGLGFIKPETPVVVANGTDKEQKWLDRKFDGFYTTNFVGRRICAQGRQICWSEVSAPYYWPVSNQIDLPTYDCCRSLAHSEGHLYWIGQRERWKIHYVGGELVFRFEYLGESPFLIKDMNYLNSLS